VTDASSTTDGDQKPRRDREHTRALILEVAGKLLAKVGPEGLSLSQVAQIAGVNRGTAYHHFQTREQLLKEATAWVSANLCKEVFGDESNPAERPRDPRTVSDSMARFAMDNPEFGRAWLYHMLSSGQLYDDPFWNRYLSHIDAFARTDLAEPDIDTEVYAMTMLVSVFLWPVWTRAHEKSPRERRRLAKRFSDERLRLSLHGVMKAEMFPEVAVRSDEDQEDDEDRVDTGSSALSP
jgi:AcrR family transcriptional regulator